MGVPELNWGNVIGLRDFLHAPLLQTQQKLLGGRINGATKMLAIQELHDTYSSKFDALLYQNAAYRLFYLYSKAKRKFGVRLR